MEHLNKACKECVRDLGPNKTTAAIERAATSIGTIDAVITHFDSEVGVGSNRGLTKDQATRMTLRLFVTTYRSIKYCKNNHRECLIPLLKIPKT